MKLDLKRQWFTKATTIGELFVDGVFTPINATLGQVSTNSIPLRLG